MCTDSRCHSRTKAQANFLRSREGLPQSRDSWRSGEWREKEGRGHLGKRASMWKGILTGYNKAFWVTLRPPGFAQGAQQHVKGPPGGQVSGFQHHPLSVLVRGLLGASQVLLSDCHGLNCVVAPPPRPLPPPLFICCSPDPQSLRMYLVTGSLQM